MDLQNGVKRELAKAKVQLLDFYDYIQYWIEYHIMFKLLNGERRTSSGHTGMTIIKTIGIVLVPIILIGGYFALPYLVLHKSVPVQTVPNQSAFTNGVVVSGGGTVSVNVVPMDSTVIATPNPTVFAPSPYPSVLPSVNPADYVPGGKYNPLPSAYLYTPTPGPVVVPPNNQYLDERDFMKCTGLTSDYVITKDMPVSKGKSITFDTSFTNLKGEPINALSGVLTLSAYALDGSMGYMQPYIPTVTQNIVDIKGLNMRQYDSYRVNYEYKVPDVPAGQYLVQLNIHGDNGATCQIMEMVTVS